MATASAPTPSLRGLTPKQKKDVIEKRKAEIEEVRKTMNPQLQKEAENIENALSNHATSGFKFFWDMGARLIKIRDEEESKYGNDPLAKIRAVLDYTNQSALNKAMQFRECFDENELKTLMTARAKLSGNRLSWRHVEVLMQCKSAKKRSSLIKRACDEDLTVDELFKLVRAGENRGTDKHAGGREVKVPPTITGRVENLQKYTKIIVRNQNEIWTHPEHGFINTIDKLDASKLTPELLNSLQHAAEYLDQVDSAVTNIRNQLTKGIEIAQRRMEEQAKHKNGEADETPSDEE
jgi:hypothetical protein